MDIAAPLQTGIKGLDRRIKGLRPGELMLVAARPSQGSTAFALSVAAHVFSGSKARAVLLFSCEMGRHAILHRLTAAASGVPLTQLRGGLLKDDQWAAAAKSALACAAAPLYLHDLPRLPPAGLAALAKRLAQLVKAKRQPLGLIVVDSGRLSEDFAPVLKRLAVALEAPVLLAATLPPGDGRPGLSDVAPAVARRADVVALLHRDAYYRPGSAESEGKAELLIAKNPRGPVAAQPLRFDRLCTRFSDL